MMEFIDIGPHILGIQLNELRGNKGIAASASKMKEMLEHNEHLKLYLEIANHKEQDEAAYFEKLTVALQNFTPFEKIAVVTPTNWIERYSEVLAGIGATDLKVFETNESDEARKWINEEAEHKQNTEPGPGKLPKKGAPDQGLNQT